MLLEISILQKLMIIQLLQYLGIQMSKINNNQKTNKKQKIKIQKISLNNFTIQQLYEKAIRFYQQTDTAGQNRWNKMLAQSGTKKDKISAAGVLILQNPQSSLKYFDLFIKWCFDKNHNFAISACQALANVFSQHVFTDKKGLKDFAQSVQTHIKENKKNLDVDNNVLIAFYLQSQLKQYYSQFVKAIQILLNEGLVHIKKVCIKVLGNLARHNQLRRTILALIINKLGDTDMEVVNQVSKCLKDQFYQDILASQALMQETERFLFRANLPNKAQFFVINFLNSINLKFLNQKTLNRLFQIFYHFFTKCISHKQNADQLSSRLFLNSIKGLNKVFAFIKGGSKQTKKIVEQKIQDVYKIVHTTTNLKAKIQLLLFLFQSHVHLYGSISSNNRFYRVLYEFIGKNQIIHCSLLQMFFDLLLVCMNEDENLNRVLAITKRMLQLCFTANSAFVVTTLLMIDKVAQQNQGFKIFLKKPQNIMGDHENQNIEIYDYEKRDPLFAGAQKTCLWQLRALCVHYHPTVSKFANALVSGQKINYQGHNPILQFNLTSFIQKMSLKKQKKSEAWKIKVKRNLTKIRSSKYQSLLNKQLTDFKQDQDYIKRYIEKRNQIHTNKNKMQTKDIEQYADQVIQQEMDRLNPQQIDQELSITPEGEQQEDLGSWDQQNQGNFSGQEDFNEENQQLQLNQQQNMDGQFSGDMQMYQDQLDEEAQQQGQQQKQFEDVFDQIRQDDQHQFQGRKNKSKRFGFNKKTKNIGKSKQNRKARPPNKKVNGFKNKTKQNRRK